MQEKLEQVRQRVPAGAYATGLADPGLSTRVLNLLLEAGYQTAGQVLEQLELEPDKILALQGIGPKAMDEIREKLASFEYPEPVQVAPEAVAAEPITEQPAEIQADGSAPAEATEAAQPAAGLEVVELPVEQPTEVSAEAMAAQATDEAQPPAQPLEAVFKEAVEMLQTAVVEVGDDEEREAPEAALEAKPKVKKAKKRARVVEYDPDLGTTVVRHKRKSGRETDWETGDETEES
jgi:hypothetical protein